MAKLRVTVQYDADTSYVLETEINLDALAKVDDQITSKIVGAMTGAATGVAASIIDFNFKRPQERLGWSEVS